MEVPPEAPGSVRGTLLLEDGSPCEEGLIELLQHGRVHWTWTDEAGRFQLNDLEPSEQQDLIVLVEGHLPETFTIAIPGNLPSEVTWTLAPRLKPLPTLPPITWGNLKGQLLRGMPGARGDRSLSDFEVWLVPQEGADPMLALGERRIPVFMDGTFSVESLLAGDYFARALPSWAHGGSWPILGQVSFHFDPADDAGTLSIPMVEGQLGGTLVETSGSPLAGALLILRNTAGDRIWPPQKSDAAGTFRVSDLPPGDYILELIAGVTRAEREVVVRAGSFELVRFGLVAVSEVDEPAPDQ